MNGRILVALGIVGLALAAWPGAGRADLKTSGSGKDRTLDASQFSGKRADQYRLFQSRCTKCHDMTKPLAALETGVGPVTGAKFDRDGMKAYVVDLMRKPNSGVTKEEVPELLDFMAFARDLAQQKKDAVVPFGPGMERPKKKSGPDPTYTREAREAKVEGKMMVQCVVQLDGRLTDCKVLKSLPFMEQSVLGALARQQWEPATSNGKALPVLYTIALTFKLKD
jgi:TonB family protein